LTADLEVTQVLRGVSTGISSRSVRVAWPGSARWSPGHCPGDHDDPFDRMLVAQAQVEGLSIVTSDRHIARYGVAVLAAA